MIVYRVEDKDGGGPYNGPSAPHWGDRERAGIGISADVEGHPLPSQDIPSWESLSYDEREKFNFGFESLEALEAWFNEKAREYYRPLGFMVARYNVNARSVKKGGHQVGFKIARATLIDRTELRTSQFELFSSTGVDGSKETV